MVSVNSPRILEFLEKTLTTPEEYHQKVLVSLAKIFGYQHSVIFRADRFGNLSDPLTFNIKEKMLNDYVDSYHKIDMFHPRQSLNTALKKNVMCIQDIKTYASFEKSEFYNNFLKRYNAFYQMAIYFFNGNRLLSIMGLIRPPNQKDFDTMDIKTMEVLSKHISKTLASNRLLSDLEYEKKILEAYTNNSSTGLIVLDQTNYQVKYFNSSALEICSKLVKKEKWTTPIDYFVNQFLRKNYPSWQNGTINSVFSSSFERFTIHVTPCLDQHNEHRKLYSIYLMADEPSSKTTFSDHNSNQYGLTPKELEILELVTKGYSNEEIGQKLFIGLSTVKTHMQNIFRKCGVTNRTSLCYKIRLN